jgi:7-carboxy-7-deazaguanine synthase
MNVSEIFGPTIQGEGSMIGVPCVFIRTSGCNLRCKWDDNLCDTEYTSWNPETNEVPPIEVIRKAISLCHGTKVNHIVISGGEPTIQAEELGEVVRELVSVGFHVTIETNGTQLISPSKVPASLLSISPKLSTSVPRGTQFEKFHNDGRIRVGALKQLLSQYESYLKFVVSKVESDIKEIVALQETLKLDSSRIFLMPEGRTARTRSCRD